MLREFVSGWLVPEYKVLVVDRETNLKPVLLRPTIATFRATRRYSFLDSGPPRGQRWLYREGGF